MGFFFLLHDSHKLSTRKPTLVDYGVLNWMIVYFFYNHLQQKDHCLWEIQIRSFSSLNRIESWSNKHNTIVFTYPNHGDLACSLIWFNNAIPTPWNYEKKGGWWEGGEVPELCPNQNVTSLEPSNFWIERIYTPRNKLSDHKKQHTEATTNKHHIVPHICWYSGLNARASL